MVLIFVFGQIFLVDLSQFNRSLENRFLIDCNLIVTPKSSELGLCDLVCDLVRDLAYDLLRNLPTLSY